MVDRYPLGFNANFGALRDWNRYIAACKMLGASHQMAMIKSSGDPRADIASVIRAHQEIGAPDLQWIIRVFSSHEGDWKKFNVDAYVAYCTEIHRHFPNVIFDAPANEPGVPDNEVEAFVDNQVSLIEKFAAKGIRYAATAYGMGSPHWEHITGGRYDKLLYALAKYDTAYLSLHEYSMGWLEAGSGFGYEILLDPANLSKYWLTKWQVQEGHFLIRRADYWALRCDALGIRRARVFLTECPLDQNPDGVSYLNNNYAGVWDSVRYQYGLQKYNFDLRGLDTYPEYWAETFPNLTYDEALAKVLIHFVEDCMYVDYIVAGFMFAWNVDWAEPEGTDMSIVERTPTIQLLSNHAKNYVRTGTTPVPTPPVPEEPPQPEYRLLHIEGYNTVRKLPVDANVRLTPNGSVIGILPAMPTVTIAKVSLAPATPQDDYDWIQVILHPDTDNAITGWIANHVFRIAVTESVPDYKAWYEADLVYWRQYHINKVAEHAEEILQIDNKLELLRAV